MSLSVNQMNDAEATAGIIDCLEAGAKDYPPVKIKPIAISADDGLLFAHLRQWQRLKPIIHQL